MAALLFGAGAALAVFEHLWREAEAEVASLKKKSQERMEVFVKDLAGRTVTLRLAKSDTMETIKARALTDLLTPVQALLFRDGVPLPECGLVGHHLKHGDLVHVRFAGLQGSPRPIDVAVAPSGLAEPAPVAAAAAAAAVEAPGRLPNLLRPAPAQEEQKKGGFSPTGPAASAASPPPGLQLPQPVPAAPGCAFPHLPPPPPPPRVRASRFFPLGMDITSPALEAAVTPEAAGEGAAGAGGRDLSQVNALTLPIANRRAEGQARVEARAAYEAEQARRVEELASFYEAVQAAQAMMADL